ncbi:superoxide dismutase [Flagellimonas meridianipacifica]|uniref:Superoxide dismutase n=1 Tax=Flagellimonas meridianipacifica TaxID=1080225 RepID=A0A2T0MA34_9FLAO|nr:superoxide dismutase [Allomuricauda pacifica]PRX54325.1 Fe-Mn family superoxide dismutase [Allomuricauda pacifica]
MNKRKFLKQTVIATTGVSVVPSLMLSSCKTETKKEKTMETTESTAAAASFTLPEIPYGYNAFPDTIDAMTMEIHHSKHHQGYTNKLNAALEAANISGKSIEEILTMENLPTAIRNNGGGFYNHTLYWDILTPGGQGMSDAFKAKVVEDFGSEEALKNQLAEAGAKRFGSGWAWLCQDADNKLHVCSTPNQDNPLMKVAERMGTPLLGIDVWEHAYYLKYQNKRGEYLQNILKIINWEKVGSRMS